MFALTSAASRQSFPDPESAAPRQRLIRGATALFQRRGYHAVGITEILEAAQTPRGSLYYQFPGGKPELACRCIDWVTGEVVNGLHKARHSGHPAADIFAGIATATAAWLEASNWTEGSLLAALTQGTSPEDTALADALAHAYRRIRREIATILALDDMQRPEETADSIVANLEGATILARALQSREPLLLAAESIRHRLESN
ncbi:TetR/AcrR family transcriptional regulator [Aquisalimonas lutea]|uniref:TetR/AcrR family transcriptional regulator n=1 Tax=Aquisalimonas lutea TaxID=1327750 RepID=UPI0025B32ED0|nr:TetR/AcrR family transcriptional regulator [Aquisalimonas lutea]MDN3516758.1 TetR/AcrR family transcriptional regulator [Aquisalimonas lutea]